MCKGWGSLEDCWRIANHDCVGQDWEGYEDNRQIVRVVWILGGLRRSKDLMNWLGPAYKIVRISEGCKDHLLFHWVICENGHEILKWGKTVRWAKRNHTAKKRNIFYFKIHFTESKWKSMHATVCIYQTMDEKWHNMRWPKNHKGNAPALQIQSTYLGREDETWSPSHWHCYHHNFAGRALSRDSCWCLQEIAIIIIQ